MKVTLYRQSECDISQTLLKIIKDMGHEPDIIDLVEHPPTRAQLVALLVGLRMTPRDILRRLSPSDAALADDELDDHTLLGMLSTRPELIDGPIAVTEKGIRLCHPAEQIIEIL